MRTCTKLITILACAMFAFGWFSFTALSQEPMPKNLTTMHGSLAEESTQLTLREPSHQVKSKTKARRLNKVLTIGLKVFELWLLWQGRK